MRPDQICDVRYADLMREPVGALARVYAHFGMELSRDAAERVRAYLAAKPKAKHGAHRYAFEQLGREAATERERFRSYQERYGVPSE